MSKIDVRAKGQRGEREAIKVLQPVVNKVYSEAGLAPPRLERNLMQSMKGGFDIVGLEWMALEVKNQETLQLIKWWDQTTRQAGKNRVPVLMYKQSRIKWRVMLRGRLRIGESGEDMRVPVDVTLEVFLAYFEKRLLHQISVDFPDKVS